MKIAPALASIKALVIRQRLMLAISLGLILLTVGSAYGWKVYTHRQSPEFALEKLNKALLLGKKQDLANLVDFRSLALHFASTIYVQRPQTPATGTRDQSVMLVADEIQRLLFTALDLPKDDKAPPPVPPETPLAPLPANFSLQLAGKLTLQSKQEGTALAAVTINYGRVEKDFPLVLLMEKKPDGWRVTCVANAEDLVAGFVRAENSLTEQRLQAWEEKNLSEQSRMNEQLDIHSCTAAVSRLSDQKTILLTVQLVALNKGPHTIHNMNLVATFTPHEKPEMEEQRHINIAVRMPLGEHITHTYNAELHMENPQDAALAEASAIECKAYPRAMALGSGVVLHLREKPTR